MKIAEARRYVSVEEAAKLLNVSTVTVHSWMLRGRVKYKTQGGDLWKKNFRVLRSSLKTASNVVCKYCGVTFQSRRPEKARFCCIRHKDLWMARKRGKGYAKRGRPPLRKP